MRGRSACPRLADHGSPGSASSAAPRARTRTDLGPAQLHRREPLPGPLGTLRVDPRRTRHGLDLVHGDGRARQAPQQSRGSRPRATASTRRRRPSKVFRLARAQPGRPKRVYIYHGQAVHRPRRCLLMGLRAGRSSRGLPRPAYKVLKTFHPQVRALGGAAQNGALRPKAGAEQQKQPAPRSSPGQGGLSVRRWLAGGGRARGPPRRWRAAAPARRHQPRRAGSRAPRSTIYTQLPEAGRGASRDMVGRGEARALRRSAARSGSFQVNFIAIDASPPGGWDGALKVSAVPLRDAIADPQVIAMIGPGGSDTATARRCRCSTPSGILQVTPGAGYPGFIDGREPRRAGPSGSRRGGVYARAIVGDDRACRLLRCPGPRPAPRAAAAGAGRASRSSRSPGRIGDEQVQGAAPRRRARRRAVRVPARTR